WLEIAMCWRRGGGGGCRDEPSERPGVTPRRDQGLPGCCSVELSHAVLLRSRAWPNIRRALRHSERHGSRGQRCQLVCVARYPGLSQFERPVIDRTVALDQFVAGAVRFAGMVAWRRHAPGIFAGGARCRVGGCTG